MKSIFTNKSKGFTLIELLVVIAIIGILSSVVLASLNSARVKARDAARMATVREVKTALELYYDTNNAYPIVTCGQNCGNFIGDLAVPLAPYMSSMPADPNSYILYVSGSNGAAYGLKMYNEQKGTYCMTGVNVDPAWWNPTPLCGF